MSDAPRDDRLDSWKEIAAYLKRDVTTVQRWERREGMPVHRHLHGKLGSVYAFRRELDEWSRARSPQALSDNQGSSPVEPAAAEPPRRRGRLPLAGALAAAALLLAAGAAWWLTRADDSWAGLIAGARLERITAFDGTERAAAVSRDGKLVAFLSNRDGSPDVWVTQVGTGNSYNLTRGAFDDLVNDAIRNLGFSPDGALVTFWARKPADAGGIGVWAVPTLGGPPRPYLEGAAEFDWSSDLSQLVYHTPGPGDPMLVREQGRRPAERKIFAAPPGVHAHFPLWSPDRAFIYFVQGSVPDAMDVWRIRSEGGVPERLTHHDSRVSHPVMLDARTLLYLATDADREGPWLHELDVERRVPRRLRPGLERYTSLAASADGRRLVATLAGTRETFWRLPMPSTLESVPVRIPLTTGRSFSPRLGPGCLLYGASRADGDAIWKLTDGTGTELWTEPGARIVGGPEVERVGGRIAFAVVIGGKAQLVVMNADGTKARVVTDSLELRGAPAWAPDGRSITVAADDGGVPRLFAVPLDRGSPVRLAPDYAVDPVWSPDGQFIAYSGADIGTRFPVKAMGPDGRRHELPNVVLTRGARCLRFLPAGGALIVLRGELGHKDLWLLDLATGAERPLTRLPSDFDVSDFDISPDGGEVVLHRVQEQSDVVMLELAKR